MCFDGCGQSIEGFLTESIEDCIIKKQLPRDAELMIAAQPSGLGLHRLNISIVTDDELFIPHENLQTILSEQLKQDIIFSVVNEQDNPADKLDPTNWVNLIINLMAMGIISLFMVLFPPSVLLTRVLIGLSFLTTAFTARKYLFDFIGNVRNKHFASMSTTISLGWLLSLAHTLFHTSMMPMSSSFSMGFMNFMMPILLIGCINGMDEIKRVVLKKSQAMQLSGLNRLFPEMAQSYSCHSLSKQDYQVFRTRLNESTQNAVDFLSERLKQERVIVDKDLLKEGMLIEINAGECFPVDCILVQGNTVIDASLLTGESQQNATLGQSIPAGAINLSAPVVVCSSKTPYQSAVNGLLFRANRARNPSLDGQPQKFVYLYSALILLGMAAAVFVPLALSVATFPLIAQNLMGILFSICPCTLVIAHQLPNLIRMHQCNKKGIYLRDEQLIGGQVQDIHTVVFDKTGTLTTGNCVVESTTIPIISPLWQRMYLLEKQYGRGHPVAKAIVQHCGADVEQTILINTIEHCQPDPNHRGLSAMVQGKWLQMGNREYLKSNQISLPDDASIPPGCSAVYVAEDGVYQGVVYIKHALRAGVHEALWQLKNKGVKLILITGDHFSAAHDLNRQLGHVFCEEDIYAEQTPNNKETILAALMMQLGVNPKGIWFVGDGLNDAPCCRIVSEKGGVSCAMNTTDKSAFFTDLSLNGTLDYLFQHTRLNDYLKKTILQNKAALIFSALSFISFIVSFSTIGVAVSPLIPMLIMLSTTAFVLFNAYRIQLATDEFMDKKESFSKKMLISHGSVGVILGSSALLVANLLVTTLTTKTLFLPMFTFTSAAYIVSSLCTLGALGALGSMFMILAASWLSTTKAPIQRTNSSANKISICSNVPSVPLMDEQRNHNPFVLDRLSQGKHKDPQEAGKVADISMECGVF